MQLQNGHLLPTGKEKWGKEGKYTGARKQAYIEPYTSCVSSTQSPKWKKVFLSSDIIVKVLKHLPSELPQI